MVKPENHGSFVARLWLEGGAQSRPTWRGHIRHVQGEEECFFQDLSAMKAFLEQISDVPVPVQNREENEKHQNE